MYKWNLETERLEAEEYLCCRRTDFTATYMKVASLQFIIAQQPEIIRASTAGSLQQVLEGSEHSGQRQAFFLFKKAGEALADIICRAEDTDAADKARKALSCIISGRTGYPLRAAAEAAGSLPVSLNGGSRPFIPGSGFFVRELKHLDKIGGLRADGRKRWLGRSLVMEADEKPGRLLVLKFARPGQDLSELASEIQWMKHLSSLSLPPKVRFAVPEPLFPGNPVILKISDPSLEPLKIPSIDPGLHAVGFKALPGYFAYPNGSRGLQRPGKKALRLILSRSARLLGYLASLGIIHTAPIPLFHNRVQSSRRCDRGLYEWRRGGRLDQWLASCSYPNISRSGIRDFEHFTCFDGPVRKLYEHIGSHVLSLVLVAGSYFRSRDRTRQGLDEKGRPADARDLFDEQWLAGALEDIFINYYKGFTGLYFKDSFPVDVRLLSSRLVEEMGVDRHMEEILRLAEQNAMTRREFQEFLAERGYTMEEAARLKKGKEDIKILTGPHLGGFNQRISVPELTEYTAALSARCIMDRHWLEKFGSMYQ